MISLPFNPDIACSLATLAYAPLQLLEASQSRLPGHRRVLRNLFNSPVLAPTTTHPLTQWVPTACRRVLSIQTTKAPVSASQMSTATAMPRHYAPISTSHHAITPPRASITTRRIWHFPPRAETCRTVLRAGFTRRIYSMRCTGTRPCSQICGLKAKALNRSSWPTVIKQDTLCTAISSVDGMSRLFSR